jgi:hypothetical protein
MHLSLYLDDCADDDTLAALLRQAGHQVSTPRIAGTSGLLDREHLDYAAQRGYTLLTKDPDDFIDLHHQWLATNRTSSVSGFDSLLFTSGSQTKARLGYTQSSSRKTSRRHPTAPSPEPRVGQ